MLDIYYSELSMYCIESEKYNSSTYKHSVKKIVSIPEKLNVECPREKVLKVRSACTYTQVPKERKKKQKKTSSYIKKNQEPRIIMQQSSPFIDWLAFLSRVGTRRILLLAHTSHRLSLYKCYSTTAL